VLFSTLILLLITSLFINAQSGGGQNDQISIGLLVNDLNETIATCSAELAVKEINDTGGINGKPLNLIIRSVEGSWGTGSSEVVDLVFKQQVSAIIGSIDGRNSHLAEQVIAKTQVIYLSAWASDPTLSKAYVPYYFSLVPTDDQQAALMLKELSDRNESQRILVVHDQSYDAEQALKSLDRLSSEIEKVKIITLPLPSVDPTDLHKRIENENCDALILLGRQIPVPAFLKQLKISGKSIPVYTNLAAQESAGYLSVNHNSRDELNTVTKDFKKMFLDKCNTKSGPIASYTYDGIMIIAEVLKKSGNDQGSLVQNMSRINYQGLTSVVEFDSRGRVKNSGEQLLIKE